MSSASARGPGQHDRRVLTLVVDHGNDAPGIARGAISAFCETREVPELALATVKLLVSEVVTNAVTHPDVEPPANVRLVARVEADIIRVEVTDQGNGFQPATPSNPTLNGPGYGLFLLDKQAVRWGVDDVGGNRVWFEVALDYGD